MRSRWPGQPGIIVARNRDLAAIHAALAQALAQARQHGCSRIWVVRTHVLPQERLAWRVALLQHKLTLIPAGHNGLGVVRTGGPGCR